MWKPTTVMDPHQNRCEWFVLVIHPVFEDLSFPFRCIPCQDELGSQKLLVKNHCSTNQWANGFEDPRHCSIHSIESRRFWKILEVCTMFCAWCADLRGRPGKQGQTLNFNYLNYFANPQIVSRTRTELERWETAVWGSRCMVSEVYDFCIFLYFLHVWLCFSSEFWGRRRIDFLPGSSTFHGEMADTSMLKTEVTMPHTVQAYSLLDPAPTYGNSNFSDLGTSADENSKDTWAIEPWRSIFGPHKEYMC